MALCAGLQRRLGSFGKVADEDLLNDRRINSAISLVKVEVSRIQSGAGCAARPRRGAEPLTGDQGFRRPPPNTSTVTPDKSAVTDEKRPSRNGSREGAGQRVSLSGVAASRDRAIHPETHSGESAAWPIQRRRALTGTPIP